MLANNCLLTNLRSPVYVVKMKLWRRGRSLLKTHIKRSMRLLVVTKIYELLRAK